MPYYAAILPAALTYTAFICCLTALSTRLAGRAKIRPGPVQRAVSRPATESGTVKDSGNRLQSGLLAGFEAAPALAVFLLLPAGSLPPLIRTDFGILFILALFALAFFIQSRGQAGCLPPIAQIAGQSQKDGLCKTASAARLYGLSSLAGVALLAAFIALYRGLPGEMFDAGLFRTLPLWSVLGVAGRTGLLCLGAGLLIFTGRAFAPKDNATFARQALCLANAHFTLVLLLPFAPSGPPPLWSRTTDMFSISQVAPILWPFIDLGRDWVLVFALVFLLWPLIVRFSASPISFPASSRTPARSAGPSASPRFFPTRTVLLPLILFLTGAALCVCDTVFW
ncbi:MAG: hypothetical protein LBN33_03635 [Desulfovibrio sp.]|nr:hypothetical protein [Desulfovibrio sp.]